MYLQAGGKEILVDRIRNFARVLRAQGASVRLNVWEHMTHEFHAYGDTMAQSREAIACIRAAICWATDATGRPFPASAHYVLAISTMGVAALPRSPFPASLAVSILLILAGHGF